MKEAQYGFMKVSPPFKQSISKVQGAPARKSSYCAVVALDVKTSSTQQIGKSTEEAD